VECSRADGISLVVLAVCCCLGVWLRVWLSLILKNKPFNIYIFIFCWEKMTCNEKLSKDSFPHEVIDWLRENKFDETAVKSFEGKFKML
jgi:hypothetical protein